MSVKDESRSRFLSLLAETKQETITSEELRALCAKHDMKVPQWFTKDEVNRAGRGIYKIPTGEVTIPAEQTETVEVQDLVEVNLSPTLRPRIQTMVTKVEEDCMIPSRSKNYIPFGNFDDLKLIILSKQFFPVFITGPSGNGKTLSIEQVCALLGREYVCASMTPETDEGDLLGNYVLIDNQMVWRDGIVTVAARRGAVLCLDEIDYGAQNLSCLQRVLEGKPFLLKKKGEVVTPKDGFQIIATANTKGKGSEDGRYMFTNVLNEAFLERFPITFEQEWAPNNIETRIIRKELELLGKKDDEFAENLVVWATTIRKTYEEEEGCSEVISTRRLVHIARAYPIFNGDRLKAITFCLNRFDEMTKKGFLDLYSKIDASIVMPNTVAGGIPPIAPAPGVTVP